MPEMSKLPGASVDDLLRRPGVPMSMAERVQRRRLPSGPSDPAGPGDPAGPIASGPGVPVVLAAPVEWVRWFGVGRVLAIAVSVALVGAGATWLLAPPPPPVEASLPFTSPVAPSSTASSSTVPAGAAGAGGATNGGVGTPAAAVLDIVVHVAGAVRSPGIHRLSADARVADAVAAAGGPTVDAHTDAINLAAVLRDGDRVHVPRTSEGLVVPAGVTAGSSPPSGAGAGTGAPVSINTATAAQLDTLPGVGPATAAAIVAHRETSGPFGSIDALADVRGIGPAKLENLRPFVTL